MKLTIFAATGGIGRELLTQALAAGHDVTAAVRSPQRLAAYAAAVRTTTVDLADPDPAAMVDAVSGADAVLSALGPRSRADAGVATSGTRAIGTAMRAAGTRRLVVVSAAPVGTVPSPARPHPPKHDPGDGIVMRHLIAPLLRRAFRHNYADLAEMEELLRGTDLDWTVSRPPRLTNGPRTGTYRTAYGRNLQGGATISRADVAHHMLRLLDMPESIGRTVGIAY